MVRVFMRANTIMKMTRVVTLLFSDKKSEEEKGAFFFLDGFCHAWREQKIYESFICKKEVTVTQKGMATFRQPLFPRQTHRRIEEIAFCVFGF